MHTFVSWLVIKHLIHDVPTAEVMLLRMRYGRMILNNDPGGKSS